MVLGPRADPGGPGLTYRRGVAKHSERDHRAQLDELVGRLSTVVLAVARQTTTRDVLQVIVSSARSLADARYAALGVPDDRGSFAEFVTDGIPERQRRAIGPLPRQHGMLGVLLREGRPVRLADIRADPRFEGWPAAHPRLSDFLGVPIRDRTQVLGIIFAACKRSPGGFTERDERLMELFAAHAAIALTNARLYEQSRELAAAQERARLARDLHDAVAQKLFGIRAKASAARARVPRDPEQALTELKEIAVLGAEARAVIDGLAPPDLPAGGLAGSLRSYCVLAGRTQGVTVEFTADELPELCPDRQAAIYRIGQEAVHNALRHSGARRVQAALSGGQLAIRSEPGNGTRVRLSVPIR